MRHLALLAAVLALAGCLEPGEGAVPPRDPPPGVDTPPATVTPQEPPPPPPAEPEPEPCLGAVCADGCCLGGRCDDAGLCAVTPPPPPPPPPEEPPPPGEEPPPPPEEPQLVEHRNTLAGFEFTFWSWQPLDTHDGWSALQAIEAWSADPAETTWNVCSYSGCYCRRRAGTALVATICPDPAFCQGCTDIGAGGYMIVTDATLSGYPKCLAADYNCPTPTNAGRVVWH